MTPDRIIACDECGTLFVWPVSKQDEPAASTRCPMCQLLAPPMGRQRGTVKWFSRAKGYGFITSVSGSEVFLHRSGMGPDQPLPRAGQLVEFGLTHGPRGAQADRAVILSLENDAWNGKPSA